MSKWDALAKYFSESNASSADNVEIVEPVLLGNLKKIRNLRLIDFGCGSGNFCKRVSAFADSVLGIDSSEGMIRLANERNKASNTKFTTLPIWQLGVKGYNVLNSEFAIEFLNNGELSKLLECISGSSITRIFVSNQPKDFIDRCIKDGKANFCKDSGGYAISLNRNVISLFPRSVSELADLFGKAGFKLESVTELAYPETFLSKFPEWKECVFGDTPPYNVLEFTKSVKKEKGRTGYCLKVRPLVISP